MTRFFSQSLKEGLLVHVIPEAAAEARYTDTAYRLNGKEQTKPRTAIISHITDGPSVNRTEFLIDENFAKRQNFSPRQPMIS